MTPYHQHWLDSLSAIIPCLSLLISDMGNWKLEIVRKYPHRWRFDREENRVLELFIDRHGVLREFSVDGHVPFQSARIIQRSSDWSSQTISSTTESRTGKELSHKQLISPYGNFFLSSFQDELIRQLKERERLRRESEVLEQMSQFQSKQRETGEAKWSLLVGFSPLSFCYFPMFSLVVTPPTDQKTYFRWISSRRSIMHGFWNHSRHQLSRYSLPFSTQHGDILFSRM